MPAVGSETPSTLTKPKRVREKAGYRVEVPAGAGGIPQAWQLGPPEVAGPHEDTGHAIRAITKAGKAGKYRIVRVCWTGEVKTETKTVTKLEPA